MIDENKTNTFYIISDNIELIENVADILNKKDDLCLIFSNETENDNAEIANCKYYFKMSSWRNKKQINKLAPDGRNTKDLHNYKNEIVINGDIDD